MFSWLWFFLGRLFLFCKQLTDQVSFSLSWIRYLCVQFTSTLTLQQFVNSQTIRTVHTLTLYLNVYTTATSPQRQRPLKRVTNRENNFLTTASFFSGWWKSQEWSWNLLRMALWWLTSRQLHFDFVSFIYLLFSSFYRQDKNFTYFTQKKLAGIKMSCAPLDSIRKLLEQPGKRRNRVLNRFLSRRWSLIK